MEDAALLGPTGPGSHSSAPPSPSRWPECPRSISLSASQRLEFAALDTTGMERNCWRFLFVCSFFLYLGKGICLRLIRRIERNVKNFRISDIKTLFVILHCVKLLKLTYSLHTSLATHSIFYCKLLYQFMLMP